MESLERLGLTDAEQAVYLALLRLGEASASEIAKQSGIHRTNVYTLLDKLIAMGLAGEFQKDHVKHYRGSHPDNLLRYLEETKASLQEGMQELYQLYDANERDVHVDVYHGRNGMKAAFQAMIQQDTDGIGFGIAGQLRKNLPVYAKQWIRDMSEHKHRYIYGAGTEFTHPAWQTRTLPEEYISPVAIQVYADKTFISIWEPTMVAIVIHSEYVSQSFTKHFELLWKLATP